MRYVIIEGYRDKNEDGTLGDIVFEDCIGITNSVEEAYGIAYLTLYCAIRDSDQEGEIVTINSPTYDEDNEDEFIIMTSDNQKRIQDYCKIFALKDSTVNDRIVRNIARFGSKEDN